MKGGYDEKDGNYGRSSFDGGSLGAWHPPVAEALIVNTLYMKEENNEKNSISWCTGFNLDNKSSGWLC
jgi:hypothetical protein